MIRTTAWLVLCTLAFGGTGPLRFRAAGTGHEEATLELSPHEVRALWIDGVRYPPSPFGTEIDLPPGDHHLTLEIHRSLSGPRNWGPFYGAEWNHTLQAEVGVEAGRRYRVRWATWLKTWAYHPRVWLERVDEGPSYAFPVSGPQSASGTGITESRPMRTSAKSL